MPAFASPLPPKIAVLMPMSLPKRSTSAPPELPGLIAASVWMTSTSGYWPCELLPNSSSERFSAETTPEVTECSRPNGEPMATAVWPDDELVESATLMVGSVAGDLHDSDVGVGVAPDQLADPLAAARRLHHDRRGVLDDVVVGEDVGPAAVGAP